MEMVPFRRTFLVLEDDANDAVLIRRAFTNSASRVFVCRNTSEARAYLQGSGMYADRDRFPFPQMFVTDLRLVGESGVQFVRWMRKKEDFKGLPVIVLSGAIGPGDLHALQRLNVAKILAKPRDSFELECLLLKLSEQFCRSSAQNPKRNHGQEAVHGG